MTTSPEIQQHRRRDPRAAALRPLLALAARRRLDRLAARDGLRAARARQGGDGRQRRSRAAAAAWRFPACRTSRSPTDVDGDFDAAIIMECGDLARTGVAGLDRYFVINIDHHPGQHRLRRRSTGSIRRPRRAARWSSTWCSALGVPLTRRDRDAHLPGDPHRHRIVPLLEHLAADVRHLPRSALEAGVDPVLRRAQRLRQQQHGPAEAVRRGAERDADRSDRAASRSSTSITRWRARPAAPTRTPKG